jgi:tetratricopeptide (TPR) repeat protein
VAPGPGDNGEQQDSELPESTAPDEDVTDSPAPAAKIPLHSGTPEAAGTVTEEPAGKQQEKAYALLAAAREAYWLREYEVAESKYQALTRLEPDNPDGYGELGNMYFSQGQWDEAASAYYEAGVRLVGQGLLDQAEELAAVIRGLNGGHADDLEEKIQAARGAAN